MSAPERLWTAEDVAVFLNRKVGGVKKAAQEGTLPVPAKTRRPWTWNPDDWKRWRDRRTPLR